MMNDNDEADLNRRLQEDGVPAEETAVLLPILKQLAQPPLTPTAAQTEALLARLRPELPPPVPVNVSRHKQQQAVLSVSWLRLLLQAQWRVVGGDIWAASALVMVLGVVVSFVWQGAGGTAGLPLVLAAPVVAALGIATLYSPADGVWELEMTTAVSPGLLLLVRLLLVFGFDLLLALGGSLVLALFLPQVSLWLLVTTWLAPMTFLAALAFLFTVWSGRAEIGICASLGLWAVQVARLAVHDQNRLAFYWPDLLSPDSHPWLWGLSLLGLALALWLGSQEERGTMLNEY